MRRKISCLLSLLMLITILFSGCAHDSSKSRKINEQNDENNSQQNEALSESNNESRDDIIEYDDYRNSFKTIELTTANWNQFFEVQDNEKSPRIILREDYFLHETVVSKITFVGMLVGYDDSGKRYEIEFERTVEVEQSQAERILHFIEHVQGEDNMQLVQCDEFVLQDIKCIETYGSIQMCTLPNDKWNEDENGCRYLYVKDERGTLFRAYDYDQGPLTWESLDE